MLIIEEFLHVIDAIFRDSILTEKNDVKLPLVSLSRIFRDSDLLRFRKVDSSTCPPISFGTSSFMNECKFATSSFPPMAPYSRTSLCKLLHRTRITSIARTLLSDSFQIRSRPRNSVRNVINLILRIIEENFQSDFFEFVKLLIISNNFLSYLDMHRYRK